MISKQGITRSKTVFSLKYYKLTGKFKILIKKSTNQLSWKVNPKRKISYFYHQLFDSLQKLYLSEMKRKYEHLDRLLRLEKSMSVHKKADKSIIYHHIILL